MKSIRHSYTVLLLAVLSMMATACQKEEKDRTVNLRVEADDAPNGGKTYVSDNYICWHHGDQVNINGTAYSLSVTGTSSVTATISGVAKSESGYTAAYPAGRVSSPSSSSVTFTIPAEQTYTTLTTPTGSAQVLEMPMVGQCGQNDGVLKFRNAAALIKVTVTGAQKVYKIEVSADADANLCGSATVNPSTGVLTSSFTGGNTVTLDCSSYPNAGDFYLVVAPFTEKNITVTVWAAGSNNKKYTGTTTSSSSKTLGKNELGTVTVNVNDDGNGPYFWGGNGESSESPWLITSKEDLTTLGSLMGTGTYKSEYYLQANDIDASASTWSPISTSTTNANKFQGTYDGGGHKVKMSYSPSSSNYAFFGYVYNATVKNLTVTGTCSANSYSCVAGICSDASGATTFENCENQIDLKGGGWCAGICATVSGETVTFSSCRNNGALTVSAFSGGIIGQVNAASGSIIINGVTINSKKIESSSQYIGGIIGHIQAANTVTIGGIVTNSGAISGKNNLGGIVGYNTNSGVLIIGSNSSDRIINDATVICSGSSGNGNNYIGSGGIVGCSLGTVSVQNCKNNGRIYGKRYYSSSIERGGTGGIVGYCANGSDIDYCSNEGEIKALNVNSNPPSELSCGNTAVGAIAGLVTLMSSCTHPFPGL